MRSKKVIFLILLVILLIGGGVFYWRQRGGEEEKISLESTWDIQETPEGKIAVNQDAKISAQIPKSWIVKKYSSEVDFFSPETEFDEQGSFLDSVREKGACGIAIFIEEVQDLEIEYWENLIKQIQNDSKALREDGYSLVFVDNNPAVKRIYKQDGEARSIDVQLPIDNKIYSFESGLIINQQCVEEFEKILETVSINI